jgi:hypothetical protein
LEAPSDSLNQVERIHSENIVYEDGTGSFTFSAEENSLTWKDEKEHIADDTVFGWALVD